jgi:DNA repair exonuclease SbcCD nuclease subunit
MSKTFDFLQTSDIHVGECRNMPGYLPRHRKILMDIYDAVKKSKCALLLPGDIFHVRKLVFEELVLIAEWLVKLDTLDVPIIISTGNHDDIDGINTLMDLYKAFPYKNVKIHTQPATEIFQNRAGEDIGVVVLPWGNFSTDELRKTVTKLLPKISQCAKKVVMLHECVKGTSVDSGKVMTSGTSLPNMPEITYWAIGDIHKSQPTNLPNGWFAGAPAQFTFGDVLPKGYLAVDLNQPTKPTFVTMSSKPFKIVDKVDDITEDAYYMVRGEFEEVMKAGKLESVVKTDWVKEDVKSIMYEKIGLTEGLPEFLAEKGLNEEEQTSAVTWVTKTTA